MDKSLLKASIQSGEEGEKIYAHFKRMLNILQDEASPKGKGIDANEQQDLYEFMLNNTGHYYKYSD
jgi:hypothetical protein